MEREGERVGGKEGEKVGGKERGKGRGGRDWTHTEGTVCN